jgi:hypothetical protein
MKIIEIKTFDNIKIKVVKLEDVKEKALEFDELLENEIIFSKFQMTFKQRQKRINKLRKEFKEIFGDFKNENKDYTKTIKRENNLFVKDFKNLDSIMKNENI